MDTAANGGDIPAPATAGVVYFDGITSRRHNVTLRLGDALEIYEDGQGIASWPYADIRRIEGSAETLRLSCVSTLPLARLEIRDEILKHDVMKRCALSPVRGAGRTSEAMRVVAWSAAALVSIVLVIMYGVPLAAERLAPLVPSAFERRLGDMADNQVKMLFGGKACISPAGLAAYRKLVDTLRAAGGLDVAVNAGVLDADIPNAFALPGGKIYLFDPLLQRAENPDELAGVLAHELGHVHHRDHLRAMIQNGGTSFLIGLLFGDVTGGGAVVFATQTLLDASYSRGAETESDEFAIAVMHKLGRSPKPMGEFLYRITGAQKGRGIGILSSHPMTEDRRELMRRADRPNTGPELLNDAEWKALKTICKN